MNILTLPWLLFGVLLNAAAQLLLKAGSQRISDLSFNLDNILPMGLQLSSNPYILFGLLSYGISVVIWIGVLSRVDVSIAYPMVSLGYILNAIAAYFLFGETMTAAKISGIFLILIGVYFVARY